MTPGSLPQPIPDTSQIQDTLQLTTLATLTTLQTLKTIDTINALHTLPNVPTLHTLHAVWHTLNTLHTHLTLHTFYALSQVRESDPRRLLKTLDAVSSVRVTPGSIPSDCQITGVAGFKKSPMIENVRLG